MQPILPGSIVGVLGSGQLGRMFALAARRMGYRVHTFSPDSDTPTGQVADKEYESSYEDSEAVREFAGGVSVVTFEFENVPAAAVQAAAQCAPVRPSGEVLHVTQHRLREKTFLSQHGFPVTPFRAVRSMDTLLAALDQLGCPGVLKTASFGYDGKGQRTIHSPRETQEAWASSGGGEWIYEAFVDFERELSVIAARGADGSFAHWGVMENTHEHHILSLSVCPAGATEHVAGQAIEITRGIVEKLDLIGVLCVEFFLTKSGNLLVNELAPRPHNSGHLTIDAHVASQFEQQLRAVCGLPLGSTRQLRPAAMANLLGELWEQGEPNWPAVCALEDVKLHLYGKSEPRRGRKMGHLTALAETAQQAAHNAIVARQALLGR